jgi:hypothetical protein
MLLIQFSLLCFSEATHINYNKRENKKFLKSQFEDGTTRGQNQKIPVTLGWSCEKNG